MFGVIDAIQLSSDLMLKELEQSKFLCKKIALHEKTLMELDWDF